MIIIVAAIAGVVRLSVQQRRQQKMHLLDDFRHSLERLSNQPLPAQGRTPSGPARKSLNGRLPFKHKRKTESPRGDWDRVAPHPESLFGTSSSLVDDRADDFFGHPMDWDESSADAVDYFEEEARVRKPRRQRRPLLAGRLWAKPREPWLWTYENKNPRSRTPRRSDVAYVDFAEDDLVHAADGNLGRSGYGSRSPRSERNFAGPRGSASRGGLDPARREAAKRRLEVRRHTASRLS